MEDVDFNFSIKMVCKDLFQFEGRRIGGVVMWQGGYQIFKIVLCR